MNTNNVPELPDSTLLTVIDYIYVYKAVTKYYKVNTIVGCIDDSSCEAEQMNFIMPRWAEPRGIR